MADLQQNVGMYPATAVQGDFASANPRATAISNNGGFVSDGTVIVGGFCWATDRIVSNKGTGTPTGFVAHTGNFSYIGSFSSSTMTISKGVETTVHVAGDFYATSTNAATKGQKVFTSTTDGSILAGDAGAEVAGAVETNFKFVKDAAAGELAIISTY
ncbi:hypothetical protein DES39_0544 [Orbus hercynius]|uniref:Uncharacterized protein n=1 Tax=Orbus hercynius TaxID=593135 RepID=A0A495RJ62_9GAMM|nr:hypothetical protein [Orbus hercynius]RKS87324.1 hypothetical protein DES39_0544 [Orbus hercynius]